MPGNVFNGNGVFDGKTMALAFYSGFVDEHSTISGEACGIQIVGKLVEQKEGIDTDRRMQGKRDRRA